MRCYRRSGERDDCVLERDYFGGPNVMVWSAILFNAFSELIHVQGNLTGHRYRDEILTPVVIPFFNANRNIILFQQEDNARCHTARVHEISG